MSNPPDTWVKGFTTDKTVNFAPWSSATSRCASDAKGDTTIHLVRRFRNRCIPDTRTLAEFIRIDARCTDFAQPVTMTLCAVACIFVTALDLFVLASTQVRGNYVMSPQASALSTSAVSWVHCAAAWICFSGGAITEGA